jgi:excinuclease ABC subunit C
MLYGDLKKFKLPSKPGVYIFKKGKEILYIGKATSLQDRVRSYFSKDLIATRGPIIVDMVTQADKILHEETDSVLEALILEVNLIKKHQPKYNTKEKDNKSFNYVCITNEEVPQVVVERGRNIKIKGLIKKYNSVYGPYPSGLQLKEALRIIRKIFPFIDAQSSKKDNREFYRQLGLVPEAMGDYKNNIKNIKLFLEGKKKRVIQNLKKEMMSYAKIREFEKANEVKRRIFALEHINDVALIKEDITLDSREMFRVEAYDIAHMSGKNMVGVMTVIENGEIQNKAYRKFIIKTQTGANDTGSLEEIVSRRLRHIEWGLPDLIVVDGGVGQVNTAKRVLKKYQFEIPVIGVVKDERHKPKALIGDESLIKKHRKNILLSNSEAHRFAITFHKKKRSKNFIG